MTNTSASIFILPVCEEDYVPWLISEVLDGYDEHEGVIVCVFVRMTSSEKELACIHTLVCVCAYVRIRVHLHLHLHLHNEKRKRDMRMYYGVDQKRNVRTRS